MEEGFEVCDLTFGLNTFTPKLNRFIYDTRLFCDKHRLFLHSK